MHECLGEVVGAFFVGIFSTLGVLALLDLKWSKGRKAKEKREKSAHGLASLIHFQNQG